MAKGGRWTLTAQQGLDSLRYDPDAAVNEQDLGPEDVLVELHAASVNYRELVVCKTNIEGSPLTGIIPNLVPSSDGAGRVLAVGASVPPGSVSPGQHVVTHLVPHVPDDYLPNMTDIGNGLGQKTHGTLCRQGVFHHSALLPVPPGWSLSPAQTAALTCSALTAWNALMGLRGREVREGDWVLTQGTGGLSIAALQMAVAAGATVIATTSSDAKAERLRALGASHVVNYRATPDWGTQAKSLTPGGRGVDHVVDVVGGLTLAESLKAVRIDGLITMAGMVGGSDTEPPNMMAAMWYPCVVRGVILGTRNMFKDMLNWLHEKEVDIVVDDVEFKLEEAKSALERLEKQQHFAKVVIKMD